MRILSIAALLLALAAPAALGKPFGKARTLGTTPPAYEYDSLLTAPGPRGGVAFYFVGEKQVGSEISQRLYIARVEGSGGAHRLTSTRAHAPGRIYDGGPPYLDLAVGPHWRMLTIERRSGRAYGIPDVFEVHLGPNGRRGTSRLLGSSNEVNPFFVVNARGDAVVRSGDGFAIARAAGRFVQAPETLRRYESLPYLAADGSLFDWRFTADDGRVVAHSDGRSWSAAQSVSGPGVDFHEWASSAAGDALLVYGIGDVYQGSVIARWSRGGRAFGPPTTLTSSPDADPFSVQADATPGGRFTVWWRDGDEVLHIAHARRPGGQIRAVARWAPPQNAHFAGLAPLRDGRTALAWEVSDQDHTKPDRLMAAMIGANGKVGSPQTIAVSARGADFNGVALRRVGGARAALVWTQYRAGKKRVRIAITRP